MYLTRDVADKHVEVPQDSSPVDVPNLFKLHVHSALEVAKHQCELLIEDTNAMKSSIDFWTDMVDDLKGIQQDIELVSEKI
jgi:hypothetical protein